MLRGRRTRSIEVNDSVPNKVFAPRQWAWRVVTVGLIVYLMAVILFALTPILPEPNPLLLSEIIAASGATLAAMGLIFRLFFPSIRAGRWSYLIASVVGTLISLAFLVESTGANLPIRMLFLFFLWAGAMVALGAHLEYGGLPSMNEVLYFRRQRRKQRESNRDAE